MVMNKLELKKTKLRKTVFFMVVSRPSINFQKAANMSGCYCRFSLYVSLVLQLCMDIVVKFDLYDQIYGCNSQTGNITFGI